MTIILIAIFSGTIGGLAGSWLGAKIHEWIWARKGKTIIHNYDSNSLNDSSARTTSQPVALSKEAKDALATMSRECKDYAKTVEKARKDWIERQGKEK